MKDGADDGQVACERHRSRLTYFTAYVNLEVRKIPQNHAHLRILEELRVPLQQHVTEFSCRQTRRIHIREQNDGNLAVGSDLDGLVELGKLENPDADLVTDLEDVQPVPDH